MAAPIAPGYWLYLQSKKSQHDWDTSEFGNRDVSVLVGESQPQYARSRQLTGVIKDGATERKQQERWTP